VVIRQGGVGVGQSRALGSGVLLSLRGEYVFKGLTLTPGASALEGRVNQSIKVPHKATRGQRRSHIPAPPQGAANPASRSDAGLEGCERVATALVCETRSFSTSCDTDGEGRGVGLTRRALASEARYFGNTYSRIATEINSVFRLVYPV